MRLHIPDHTSHRLPCSDALLFKAAACLWLWAGLAVLLHVLLCRYTNKLLLVLLLLLLLLLLLRAGAAAWSRPGVNCSGRWQHSRQRRGSTGSTRE
jgi:hypothetical protein